ncbi:protein of unknown function [Azospirillum baldaniorum]|uniref:Uncharacterized protein n=1 Tax=Azospirillum baldaniorum TaxID=1064539 RepID=A0A9P1JST6_9PROT|nr:protein of unknown function [Azospirillum baldaniorum]
MTSESIVDSFRMWCCRGACSGHCARRIVHALERRYIMKLPTFAFVVMWGKWKFSLSRL